MRSSGLATAGTPWSVSTSRVDRFSSGRKRLWKVPQLWESAKNADSHKLLGKHTTLSTLPTVSAAVQLNVRSLNNNADRSLANKSGHFHVLTTLVRRPALPTPIC